MRKVVSAFATTTFYPVQGGGHKEGTTKECLPVGKHLRETDASVLMNVCKA